MPMHCTWYGSRYVEPSLGQQEHVERIEQFDALTRNADGTFEVLAKARTRPTNATQPKRTVAVRAPWPIFQRASNALEAAEPVQWFDAKEQFRENNGWFMWWFGHCLGY